MHIVLFQPMPISKKMLLLLCLYVMGLEGNYYFPQYIQEKVNVNDVLKKKFFFTNMEKLYIFFKIYTATILSIFKKGICLSQ